ncbi:1375_t:CDS:1 [Racocetra fulgida]|uniref:1375_t:CDS:1 n=1 Tax=Racocetra fulgida TaxID=60492 RepID=A0A9N9I8X7_9GLOM|nr:1375_t:CDS:1 [Racocetra fulgida]
MAVSLFPLLVVTTLYWYYVNEAYARITAFIPLKTLKEEENIENSSFAPSTSNSPKPSDNESSQITFPNTDKGKMNSLSDMEIYRAAPDLYTDYIQPPMTLYDGVLNTGMREFGAPALVGKLPWLWLPVKRDKTNEVNKPGFFHRLLGLNKSNQSIADEEREPLLSESIESEADHRA